MILPDDEPQSPTKGQTSLPSPPVDAPPSYQQHIESARPGPSGAHPQPYHSTQSVPNASRPLVYHHAEGRPEPAGSRFIKAFVVACIVWVLLGIVTESIVEMARYVGRHNEVRPRLTGRKVV